MQSPDCTQTWALPVKPEVLGAHLEAYINRLPTTTALRLCHRFGQGPDATIARLPPEMIACIEDSLLADERAKLLKAWKKDFRCFQDLCEPIEHLTRKELRPLRKLAAKKQIPQGDCELDDDNDIYGRVNVHLAQNMNVWDNEHYMRCQAFEDRIEGIFDTRGKELIRAQFSLEVCTSRVQLPNHPVDNFWAGMDIFPAETVIASLKLPEACKISPDDEKSLSASDQRRFARMMKMLDLQPHVHACQKHLHLSADEDSGEVKGKTALSWPRLTTFSSRTNSL